jgi:recombination protein RecT
MSEENVTPQEKPKETAITKVSKYLDSEMVKARFKEVVGDRSAGAFISSVMVAVKESDALMNCNVESIYISALRAATLRLSVDPSTGQAYMVPFKGHATLIVGYKGLYDMAIRTGKYRYINVGPIYEGQIVEENPITGFHTISGSITSGAKANDKVIGWIGAFEMNPARGQATGFGKTFYMTVEEIHAHAKEYSAGYDNPKGTWKKETRKMERKTALRLLLRRWGYLDPADVNILETIENEGDVIDGNPEIYNIPEYDDKAEEIHAETVKRSKEQNLKELGF